MASLSQFTYRKKLTLDTSGKTSSSLTDFPICVVVNASSWPTASERTHFFDSSNVSGKRVQFYASDGTTSLKYEVEKYDASGQSAVYWVKVPSVAGNGTTDVWVGYGNDPNGSAQDDAVNVWDSDFRVVYHMGTTLADSKSGLTLTNYGSSDVVGVVDRARDFNGTSAYVGRADATQLDLAGDFTVELWANLDTAITAQNRSYPGLIDKGADSYAIRNYGIYLNKTSPGYLHATAGSGTDHHVSVTLASAGTYLGTGVFRHIVFRNDDNVRADLLIDAVSRAYSTTYSGTQYTNAFPLTIGRLGASTYEFDGKIDEVRISAAARSDDWVAATYHSIKQTTSFNGDGWLSWGAEQSGEMSQVLRRFKLLPVPIGV